MIKHRSNDQKQIAQNRQHLRILQRSLSITLYANRAIFMGSFLVGKLIAPFKAPRGTHQSIPDQVMITANSSLSGEAGPRVNLPLTNPAHRDH